MPPSRMSPVRDRGCPRPRASSRQADHSPRGDLSRMTRSSNFDIGHHPVVARKSWLAPTRTGTSANQRLTATLRSAPSRVKEPASEKRTRCLVGVSLAMHDEALETGVTPMRLSDIRSIYPRGYIAKRVTPHFALRARATDPAPVPVSHWPRPGPARTRWSLSWAPAPVLASTTYARLLADSSHHVEPRRGSSRTRADATGEGLGRLSSAARVEEPRGATGATYDAGQSIATAAAAQITRNVSGVARATRRTSRERGTS